MGEGGEGRAVACGKGPPIALALGGAGPSKTHLGLSSPRPERLLAPSLIDFRGSPGIRALYQAIGMPNLVATIHFFPFTVGES